MERNRSTEKTEENARGPSRNFVLLLVIIFMVTFASSMISASPIYFLVKNLAYTPEATSAVYAALLSIGSIAYITANFVGGFLSDRIGRKNVIILGTLILTPSLFVYYVVPSVVWVWGVYFVHTFSIQMFQPSFQALVADSSKTKSRGKAFGNYNLFWIGSTVPAPLIGGFLVDAVGLRFPYIIASLMSVGGLFTSFWLVEASRQIKSMPNLQAGGEVEETVMPFAKVLLIFGAMGILNGLLNGMLSPLLRFYLDFKLHTTPTELGLVFSLGSSLVTTAVQIPGGILTDKVGRKPLMLSSMLGVPFLVAMAFTGSILQFILASAGLVALGNLGTPAYQAWMMDLVPSAKRARTTGIVNTLTGIGLFIGPLLSNWIFESQGDIVLPFLLTTLPWILQTPLILILKETKSS